MEDGGFKCKGLGLGARFPLSLYYFSVLTPAPADVV